MNSVIVSWSSILFTLLVSGSTLAIGVGKCECQQYLGTMRCGRMAKTDSGTGFDMFFDVFDHAHVV